jgi:hypothetical protein
MLPASQAYFLSFFYSVCTVCSTEFIFAILRSQNSYLNKDIWHLFVIFHLILQISSALNIHGLANFGAQSLLEYMTRTEGKEHRGGRVVRMIRGVGRAESGVSSVTNMFCGFGKSLNFFKYNFSV